MARSSTQVATRGATTLMAAISMRALRTPTVSMSQAVLRTRSRACSIIRRASATQSWKTPCSATVLPNATLPLARELIISKARSAIPMRRMQ